MIADSSQTKRQRLLEGERLLERFPEPDRRAPLLVTAYPSTYRTGMSNLGFHFLQRSLRSSTGARIERAFTDTAPYTLESGAPLASADAILFTVSYEEDFINLARMLLRSGIELEQARRGGSPFVIAGGAAVSANPVPLEELADLLCLGEGESTIEGIAPLLGAGYSYERLVEELGQIDGVYIKGSGGRFPAKAALSGFPRSIILTPETVFPNTLLIESGRGCPGRCSFCLATSIYSPYRALPVSEMEEYLDHLLIDPERIGLVSTAVAAHPGFGELVESLMARGVRISFGSLRAEDLDEAKIELIARAGARSVSLAPESGSQTLRYRLGKRVEDDLYVDAVRMLDGVGIRRISLYMLVGCPGEGKGEFEETRRFLRRLQRGSGRARLSLHVNPIIPKPWTPLQFFGMPGRNDLRSRLSALERLGREIGLSVHTKSIRAASRQATISLGDGRVGEAIRAYAAGRTSWRKALKDAGANESYPHEDKDDTTHFPWDHITGPVTKESLYRRYRHITGR